MAHSLYINTSLMYAHYNMWGVKRNLEENEAFLNVPHCPWPSNSEENKEAWPRHKPGTCPKTTFVSICTIRYF
jgi:hypothetical protein